MSEASELSNDRRGPPRLTINKGFDSFDSFLSLRINSRNLLPACYMLECSLISYATT